MVTVQEFQAACELARKRIAQLDLYWFGIAALAIGGLVALAYTQYGLVEHPLGIDLELRRARLGLRILGGGVILLSLNLAYRLWRVPRTQPGAHSCSVCQTRLFELMHEPIVVASRHCVGCGVKHLEDPILEDDPELIEEADYRAAAEQFAQRLGFLVIGGLLAWLLSTVVSGYLGRAWGNGLLAELMTLLGLFGPPVVCTALGAWMFMRSRWDDCLRCRWCQTNLTIPMLLVAATRNCVKCSKPVLSEHEPETVPPNALTPTELAYRKRMRSTNDWRRIVACGVGYGVITTTWTINTNDLQRTLTGAAVFLLLVIGVDVLWWWKSVNWNWPIVCRVCNKRYSYVSHVIATRRCDRCEKRTLREEDPTAEPSRR